jgi:2-polyprenyl-6-methoxyphenol hydroxylase-like FAD-dependent oxidoreductase
MDTDVIIVGAGPTGLMLANQLARRGIRIRLIDSNMHAVRESRALGVQARTLEIYQKLGVVDRALELGQVASGGNVWSGGAKKGRIAFGPAGSGLTPYPYIFILGQDDNEHILADRLRDFGSTVDRGLTLIATESRQDGVVATVRRADGSTEHVQAAWLAACDGAHSAVRELNNIKFVGGEYEQVFYVADVDMTGTLVPKDFNMDLWRGGFHLFFPMHGHDHWRIVGLVPASLRERRDLTFADVSPSVVNACGGDIRVACCSWFSIYRIQHRAAAAFRKDRIFLVGDAAHIHSPIGAQGMNTGLQDAYNLAWKLALVVQGTARHTLLDSYDAERLPIARALLRTTDRAFRFAVADNAFTGIMRTHIAARAAACLLGFRKLQRFGFRFVSQIAIQYRSGPLSEAHAGVSRRSPRAGDRFPWLRLRKRGADTDEDLFQTLDDLRFQLLIFGQTPATFDVSLDSLVQMTEYDDQEALTDAHISTPSFYLVRPDGYIGLCGKNFDVSALRTYLADRLSINLK